MMLVMAKINSHIVVDKLFAFSYKAQELIYIILKK